MTAAGTGSLLFSRHGSRTVVERTRAASPLKLLNPRNHGSGAWVYSSTYGGGLLGGDAIGLSAELREGTLALLATQASTKVYRSAHPARQSLRASLAREALLIVAPDPVVCYAGSSFAQEQEFHLHETAGLALLDWITAGRRASGERWAFERYAGRIRIFQQDRLILNDSVLLDPAHGPLAARLGRFDTLALLVLSGPPLAALAAEVLKMARETALRRAAPLLVSASPLRDSGVVLRLAGSDVEAAGRLLRQCLAPLARMLGDDPWSRKW